MAETNSAPKEAASPSAEPPANESGGEISEVSLDVVVNNARKVPKFSDWAPTYNEQFGNKLDLPPGVPPLGVFLKSIFLAVAKLPKSTIREIQEFLMTVFERDPGLIYVESVLEYNCEHESMMREGSAATGFRYFCPSDEQLSASVRFMTRIMLWKRKR